MAKNGEKIALILGVLMVVVLIGMEGGAEAISICNMDSSKLAECLPSIRAGPSPTPPTQGCCDAIKVADLHCLCSSYKAILPAFGVDPKLAMALPKKCSLDSPPECNDA